MKKVLLFASMFILVLSGCLSNKNTVTIKKDNKSENNKIILPEKEEVKLPEMKQEEKIVILSKDEEIKIDNTIRKKETVADNKKTDNKKSSTEKQNNKNSYIKTNEKLTLKNNSDQDRKNTNSIKNDKTDGIDKNKESEYLVFKNDVKENKSDNNKEKKGSQISDNSNDMQELIDESDYKDFKVKELELKKLEIEENKDFYISLKDPGWLLKDISPKLLQFVSRENFGTNTLFHLQSMNSAGVNLLFIRFDIPSKLIYRQGYTVNVLPKSKSVIDTKDTDEKEKIVFNQDYKEEKNSLTKSNDKKNNEKDKESSYFKDLANQQFDQKKYNEAKNLYLDLLKDGKPDSEIFYKLGIIEKETGDKNKAIEYFNNVIKDKKSPYYIQALIELIKTLKDLKKYNEAITNFYKYGFLDNINKKKAEDLNLLLADLYYEMNDFKSASIEYRRFLQMFPGSISYDKALFYLAYSLENLNLNAEYQEAYRLYKMLIENYPESRYYNLSKKRILYLDRHFLKIN